MEYLISLNDSVGTVRVVLASFGAKSLAAGTWIMRWDGAAASLCEALRRHTPERVVVCRLDTSDWAYL
jgi:hypothetical protein